MLSMTESWEHATRKEAIATHREADFVLQVSEIFHKNIIITVYKP